MTPDRMADLDRQIEPRPLTPVNRDFAPVAYYFDVALWSSRFNHGYLDLFRAMAGVDFRWLAGAAGALLLVLVAKKRRARTAAACCTAAMGFTLIGLEMLLCLASRRSTATCTSSLRSSSPRSWRGWRWAVGWPYARRRGGGYAPWCTCRLALRLRRCCSARCSRPSPRRRFRYWPSFAECWAATSSRLPAGFLRAQSGSALRAGPGGRLRGAVLFSVYLIPVFGFLRTAVLAAMVSLAPALMAIRSAPERPAR